MYGQKFLKYVMPAIRYAILSNASYSSYNVCSEVSYIRYACHTLCYIEPFYSSYKVCSEVYHQNTVAKVSHVVLHCV